MSLGVRQRNSKLLGTTDFIWFQSCDSLPQFIGWDCPDDNYCVSKWPTILARIELGDPSVNGFDIGPP